MSAVDRVLVGHHCHIDFIQLVTRLEPVAVALEMLRAAQDSPLGDASNCRQDACGIGGYHGHVTPPVGAAEEPRLPNRNRAIAPHSVSSYTNGAGQVATIDGPLSNDTIANGYDELGRVRHHQCKQV